MDWKAKGNDYHISPVNDLRITVCLEIGVFVRAVVPEGCKGVKLELTKDERSNCI